jgi:ABC-type glycerol-3-phosphate transport system substrate-binding protein
MKISLFQGILIGVFGIAGFAGLFIFATYSSKGTTEGGVGTVLIWGTLPKDDIDASLTEITKLESSMKSVSYIQKNPVTLPNDLSSAIATGAAPDLVLASQEQLHSLAKFLMPIPEDTLPSSAFTSTFVGEANLFAIPGGGGYYGIPFLVDPLILFSNNDILSSSGVARAPTTWEALIGLVPNIAVLTPTKQITRALIGLGTYDNVHNARGILSAIFLQTKVPISSFASTGALVAEMGETTSSGTPPGGTPPGQAVLTFYTQFADPSKVSYTWNGSLQDSQRAFQVGDLALYLGYASEARTLSAANPNLNYGVAPLPEPATATVKTTYGLVYSFMIPKGSRNPSGAYEAAALLTHAPEQVIASRATGLAPATRDVLATPPADPVAAVAYSSALYARGWLSPPPTAVDQVFSSMIGSVVSGRSGADDALSKGAGSLGLLLLQ